MTTKALADCFGVLETRVGLTRKHPDTPVFENQTHRVSVEMLDGHSSLSCDVTLKALPRSRVDAYSIISCYNPNALDAFLRAPKKRTNEVIANFVAQELSGPCAAVFEIINTSQWMQLHQQHLQSMRRRNDVFWRRVRGFDDGTDVSQTATF